MKFIKRITTTLSANMDSAVSQLENHDSIVEASIKRTRQSIAKTQAQYNSLLRQQSVIKTQLNEAQKQSALWTERASRTAQDDKDKALACVARRNHFEQEQQRLKAAHHQQQELLREVTQHLHTLNRRLSDTQQRHQLLRSRHTLAKTNKSVISCLAEDDLEQTFERWEAVVLEKEPSSYLQPLTDELECELQKQEDITLLEAQLSEILDKNEDQDHAPE